MYYNWVGQIAPKNLPMLLKEARKLSWGELRKRIIKFVLIFVLVVAIKYGFDYVFRHSDINILDELTFALGIAFIDSFADIMLLEMKEN